MSTLKVSPDDQLGVDLTDAFMDLIEQLVSTRERKGLTQQQVADRMNTKLSTVSNFENLNGAHDKNHTLRTVIGYAEAVGAFIAPIVVDAEATLEEETGYTEIQEHLRKHTELLSSGTLESTEKTTFQAL